MSQVVFCVVPHVVTPSFVELSSTGAHQPTWLGPNPIAKRVVDKKREITRMAHEIYPEGAVVATNLHSLNPTAVHPCNYAIPRPKRERIVFPNSNHSFFRYKHLDSFREGRGCRGKQTSLETMEKESHLQLVFVVHFEGWCCVTRDLRTKPE